jgi:TonB family protein
MLDPASEVAPPPRARSEFAQFSGARNAKRQSTRERVHARVVHPIDTPRLLPDPLERRDSRALSALTAVRIVIAAGLIHAALILCLAVVGHFVGQQKAYHPSERLSVKIVETPPPPPVVEEPSVEPAPVVPEFEPVTPPKSVNVPPAARAKAQDPPQPTPEPDVAPRRIVGLSMESTVEGSGPSFSTGTSRMGQTDSRAVDPVQARRAPAPEPAPAAVSPAGAAQRVASHIPTRDTQFEKPRRLRPNRPEFPAALKAQGIEGDVTVRVDIAASGAVTSVTIVRSSGHAAFDEAAKRAAANERFAPAVRDGNPVPFSLSYSYRFRIED